MDVKNYKQLKTNIKGCVNPRLYFEIYGKIYIMKKIKYGPLIIFNIKVKEKIKYD